VQFHRQGPTTAGGPSNGRCGRLIMGRLEGISTGFDKSSQICGRNLYIRR
jgi:hypothetical protein